MAESGSEIETLRRSAGPERAHDHFGFMTEIGAPTSVTG
jgi:hypothetical protein